MEMHLTDHFVFVTQRRLKYSLKMQDLVQLISRNNHSEQHEREVSHFNAIVKMRYFAQLFLFFYIGSYSTYYYSMYLPFHYYGYHNDICRLVLHICKIQKFICLVKERVRLVDEQIHIQKT